MERDTLDRIFESFLWLQLVHLVAMMETVGRRNFFLHTIKEFGVQKFGFPFLSVFQVIFRKEGEQGLHRHE